MKKHFGGIGIELLMFNTDLENEMTSVDDAMTKINDRTAELTTVAETARVRIAGLQGLFETYGLAKVHAPGDLRKLASDLGSNLFAVKNLLKVMSGKLGDIKKLQAEARASQARADQALPGYAAWFSNGRIDVAPRVMFTAEKGASPTPFAPAQKQSTVPMASAASAALSHRTISKGE